MYKKTPPRPCDARTRDPRPEDPRPRDPRRRDPRPEDPRPRDPRPRDLRPRREARVGEARIQEVRVQEARVGEARVQGDHWATLGPSCGLYPQVIQSSNVGEMRGAFQSTVWSKSSTCVIAWSNALWDLALTTLRGGSPFPLNRIRTPLCRRLPRPTAMGI